MGDKRIEFTLPTGLDRIGVRNTRMAVAGAVVTVALIASSAVALAVTGGNPVSQVRPAAAERDDTQTPVGDLLDGGNYPRPALKGDNGTTGVPARTSPRPTTPATGDQAVSDAGQAAGYRGGAGTLTPAGIATLAIAAGCSPGAAAIATAVAMAESGGSPAAQGDTTLMDATWDWSAGLWQIRGLRAQRNTGELRDSIANHDPATNAAAMYAISSGCSNWGPWTTYTRGTYRSFLGIAERAVRSVESYRAAHGGQLPPIAPRDPNAAIPVGDSGGADAAGTSPGGRSPSRAASPSSAPSTKTTRSTAPTQEGSGSSGGNSSGGSSDDNGGGSNGSNSTPSDTPTTPAVNLPTKVPTKLPTKLPTLLPTKTKLPTKLPTIKVPTKLPSVGL